MPWPWNENEPEHETPLGEGKRDSCLVTILFFFILGSGAIYGVYNTFL